MIILTDYPKWKHIDANYRGLTTEHLQKLKKEMFHMMMISVNDEAGGYVINYDADKVEEELKFRGLL